MAANPPPAMASFMEHATPAQTVSNQFVSQFYTVLHTSPRNLHRFYSEASTLTLADTRPDGSHIVKTVTGQKSIHEMVMNQGLEDTVTEVYSVDSQYSLNGGVVVQVTGTQSNKGGPKRPFVQTFFLAVQEKGFYVMNDMFRYLPDFRLLFGVENGFPTGPAAMQQVPKTNGMAHAPPAATAAPLVPAAPPMMPPAPLVQPVVPAPHPVPPPPMPLPVVPAPPTAAAAPVVASLPLPAAAVGAAPPPSAAAVLPQPPQQQQQQAPPPQPPQQQQPVQMPQQQPPQEQASAPAPAAPVPRPVVTELPKPAEPKPTESGVQLSYAERLKLGRVSLPSSPTKQQAPVVAAPAPAVPYRPAPEPAAVPPPAAAPPAAVAAAAAAPVMAPGMERSASHSGSEAGGFSMEGPLGASVFVRDIPPSVTMQELVEKLLQFGPLRPNGVNLKIQRGKDSYAFVDYESSEAAQACMDQGLDFDGHHVTVVEKRPLIFRAGMRGGRGGPPTGYSGRGDRGGYRGGGGRGGRGPYPVGPMMMDGGRGGPMGGRGGMGMGGPPPQYSRGRGDGGRMQRFDDRGRGRGPRPPMPVV